MRLPFLAAVFTGACASSATHGRGADEVRVQGLAVHADTGMPVAGATVVLRTGDEAVDFEETWSALGGSDAVKRLFDTGDLTRRVGELGGWKPSRATRTGPDGAFELAVPRDAVHFILEAEAEGLLGIRDDVFLVGASTASRRHLVILEPAIRVKGTVVNHAGHPVKGAWVRSIRSNVFGSSMADAVPFSRKTGPGGEFEFPAVDDARLGFSTPLPLVVESDAGPTCQVPVSRVRGAMVGIVIPLAMPQVIEGRVVDERGAPATGVDVVPGSDSGETYVHAPRAKSDSEGRIVWKNVRAGTYRGMALTSSTWIPLELAAVKAPQSAEDPPLVLRVAVNEIKDGSKPASTPESSPGLDRARFVVVDKATREPVRDFEAYLISAPGLSHVLPTTFPTYHSSDELRVWRVTIPGVSRDSSIFVMVRASGYAEYRGYFDERDWTERPTELALDAECVIRGRVHDSATGLPIGGSKIRWRPIPVSSYGPGHYDTVSLADGTFELRGLPRGEIQVIALTRDRVEAHSPVLDLRPGESRSLEPLVLTSGGTIRGRVVPNDVKSENVVPHIGGSVVAMFDGVLESASFPLEYFHQCHLGRDGGFELPSLRAGRWKLAWRNADRFGMPPPRWTDDGTLVDVKDGEVHEVTLTPAR